MSVSGCLWASSWSTCVGWLVLQWGGWESLASIHLGTHQSGLEVGDEGKTSCILANGTRSFALINASSSQGSLWGRGWGRVGVGGFIVSLQETHGTHRDHGTRILLNHDYHHQAHLVLKRQQLSVWCSLRRFTPRYNKVKEDRSLLRLPKSLNFKLVTTQK